MGVMLFFLVALFAVIPSKTFAGTGAGHTVFSEKQIKNRIAKIRDYYYKHPKELTKKSAEYRFTTHPYNVFKFDYYLHGKDLMFAYGTEADSKKEYRLYFYKDQIIQILIDEKGKKRVTHNQFYLKFDTEEYYEDFNFYLEIENFFRVKAAEQFEKTSRNKTDGYIFITEISYKNRTITYHKGNLYGLDNEMTSLEPKAYTAKLARKVKVKDYREEPLKAKTRTLKWLDDYFNNDYYNYNFYMCAGIVAKKGKIVEITVPYQE